MFRWVAFLCVFAFSVTAAHAQSGDTSDREISAGSIEISAEANLIQLYGGNASVSLITTQGLSLRVGYRPAMIPRSLIEIYGLRAPEDRDPYNRAPQIDAFGLTGSYLLRSPEARINPFVTLGGGLYRVDAQEQPTCRPEDGCLNEGPFFQDVTLPSAVAGTGLYVTVLPIVSVRADARLYAPIGASAQVGDSGDVRPALSVGVNFRP